MSVKHIINFFILILTVIPFQSGCAARINKPDVDPPLQIINYSPEILRGGSAVVIFKAQDINPDTLYIQLKYEKKIYPSPFIKKDFYIALLPWPPYDKDFKAFIIYNDAAGNALSNQIPIQTKKAYYPETRIKIGNYFSTNKIEELNLSKDTFPDNKMDQYKLIMKNFDEKKVLNIADATSSKSTNCFSSLDLYPFNPMKNTHISSPFGEHRIFTLHKHAVRDSYHLGLDLAGTENEAIYASNPGIVEFAGYNGANGNMILINHGYGLYSLYCHCSELFVQKGQNIIPGMNIAKSGQTGYALGDHLHFSILISGIYVNPNEWMNGEWLQKNILEIMKNSLKTIQEK